MKYLITLATILGALFWFLVSGFNTAMAGEDYNKAVIGHVITNSDKIDHSKLIEQEMQKLAYVMMLQMAETLEKTMPYIIDDITSKLRQESDQLYKCKLLEDTKIADKECSK
jgi:hypothetical protein